MRQLIKNKKGQLTKDTPILTIALIAIIGLSLVGVLLEILRIISVATPLAESNLLSLTVTLFIILIIIAVAGPSLGIFPKRE